MTRRPPAGRSVAAAWKRGFSLLSLVLFSGLVLGYLWWGKFDYHHSLWAVTAYAGAGLILLANHLVHRDDRRRLGLRLDNFRVAGKWFGGFTALAALLITVAGLVFGEARRIGFEAAATYAGWAFLQQHLLQNFLRLRGEEVFSRLRRPGTAAVLTAAALFTVYHLANLPLMTFSFLGAAAWCFLFTRTPNLLWAGLSQTVLTLLLVTFFKFGLLDQFAVGKPGFRYDFYGGGVKVAGGVDAAGRPFAATLPGPDRDVASTVRVFDMAGNKRAEWVAFAGLGFSGELAVGDLGFGPGDEIAVSPGPGPGNPPRVRIFDPEGRLLREFEVPEAAAGYGLWISIGCRRLYVCPGPAPGAPPLTVRLDSDGRVLDRWRFDDLGLVNGVRATGRCGTAGSDGDGSDRLLVWGGDISTNPSTVFVFDPVGPTLVRPLETLKTTFGVQLAVSTRSGETVFAAAPGPLRGYPPLVRVMNLSGGGLHQFAGEILGDLGCGANLGSVDMDGDGVPEWLVGDGACPGQPALVRLHSFDGRPLRSWLAYRPD